jgi:hypothetical protein
MAIAAESIAADAAMFTGVLAVARFGALADGTGRAAGIVAQNIAVRELASAQVGASSAYWALAGDAAVHAGSKFAASAGSGALIAQGNGFFVGLSSFTPIVGTLFAIGDAVDACTQ